ncbi:MAG: 2,3-bisphosphoglycerate-independent phosphoglycerate mutase [Gammaproteobacteria bacterium]|nr:2,3-bisphosphoglycerate-independent phosphoglycerate mutase [Gammaproteobacteria bacterium]
MSNIEKKHPIILIILDGWGYREETKFNAIAAANTPTFDDLWRHYPHTLLHACGKYVGLPDDQMGNSEVGHLNLGAGRVVYQDLTRISHAIETGIFFKNPVFIKAIDDCIRNDNAIHIFGLLSPGGIHSHEEHIYALIRLAEMQGAKKVYIHAFLDGRDTPPKSAQQYIEHLENMIQKIGVGQIISLVGRYYVMDRDNRWDRVEKAYDLFTEGKADYHAFSAVEGLNIAYGEGEADEFVKPTSIHPKNQKPITVNDGDCIIFMNFRADRAREITRAFTEKNFTGFARKRTIHLSSFICLTEYDSTFNLPIAFPPERLTHILGEILAENGLCQLRIAETEKYAHVTFFFNGGIETPYKGEDRILIPSPKVATYDLQPEMSAPEITEKLVAAIKSQKYDVIICNYANCDMVGHTGNFKAAVKAVAYLDICLKKIVQASKEVDGTVLITADHGNAEYMFDPQIKQPYTAHTKNPVPFIYVGQNAQMTKITTQEGALCDVAPTILHLLGLPIPKEMTGEILIKN